MSPSRKDPNIRIPRAIPLPPKPEVEIPTIPYKPILSTIEVARALNLHKTTICRYAKTGKLPVEKPSNKIVSWRFRYEDVVDFTMSDICQKRLEREAVRVAAMGRLPLSEAVDREALLTTRDAAMVLGTSPEMIRKYIYRNQIYAFQDHQAQFGSKCYVLYDAIMRLKKERERRKKPMPKRLLIEWNRCLDGWEYANNDRKVDPETAKSLQRNHSGYMSTRQVSRMMGISIGQVSRLRATGRIQGYHFPYKPQIDLEFRTHAPQRGYSHWFFKKEDVRNLMNDPSYQKRRASYKYGQSEEARRIRQEKIDKQIMLDLALCEKIMGIKFDDHGNQIEWPEKTYWGGIE